MTEDHHIERQTEAEVLSLLKPEDRLKHYQEGRSDVRSYAGFLIQVVSLLLTTMIIILGWMAGDYAKEQYQVAIRAKAPELSATAPVVTASPSSSVVNTAPIKDTVGPVVKVPPPSLAINTAPVNETAQNEHIERKIDEANAFYRQLLIHSPTTSLLLCGLCYFMLVVLGMLIMLTYQLQRRRYHYHAIGLDLGFAPDHPIVDPVLIGGALNLFIISLASIVVSMVLVTVSQNIAYMFFTTSWTMRIGLAVGLLIIGFKIYSVVLLAHNYTKFEAKEGWIARWRHSLSLIDDLKCMIVPDNQERIDLLNTLSQLEALCQRGNKEIYDKGEVLTVLKRFAVALQNDNPDFRMRDKVEELFTTLRYKRHLRGLGY